VSERNNISKNWPTLNSFSKTLLALRLSVLSINHCVGIPGPGSRRMTLCLLDDNDRGRSTGAHLTPNRSWVTLLNLSKGPCSLLSVFFRVSS